MAVLCRICVPGAASSAFSLEHPASGPGRGCSHTAQEGNKTGSYANHIRKTLIFFFKWWSRGDLNSRPPQCECDALPAEPLPHKSWSDILAPSFIPRQEVITGEFSSHGQGISGFSSVFPDSRHVFGLLACLQKKCMCTRLSRPGRQTVLFRSADCRTTPMCSIRAQHVRPMCSVHVPGCPGPGAQESLE